MCQARRKPAQEACHSREQCPGGLTCSPDAWDRPNRALVARSDWVLCFAACAAVLPRRTRSSARRPLRHLWFFSSNCASPFQLFLSFAPAETAGLLRWRRRCRRRWRSLALAFTGRALGIFGCFFKRLVVQSGAPSFEVFPSQRGHPQLVQLLVEVGEHQLPHLQVVLENRVVRVLRSSLVAHLLQQSMHAADRGLHFLQALALEQLILCRYAGPPARKWPRHRPAATVSVARDHRGFLGRRDYGRRTLCPNAGSR